MEGCAPLLKLLGAPSRRKKRTCMKFVPPIVEETEADLNLFVEADRRVTTASQPTLNALGTEKPGYRLVEAVVDSGASRSAGPQRVFPGRLRDSAMSKKGQKFKGPDGSDIPNYGEMDVAFRTNEDFDMGVVIQISDIDRTLLSVSELTAAGNDVNLRKDHGEIVNIKIGKVIEFPRRGGVYVIQMWIKDDEASVFPRLGA